WAQPRPEPPRWYPGRPRRCGLQTAGLLRSARGALRAPRAQPLHLGARDEALLLALTVDHLGIHDLLLVGGRLALGRTRAVAGAVTARGLLLRRRVHLLGDAVE